MGWILSKFRRKKSTLEELEKIETELTSLGKLKTETLVWQKKVLGHLVTYSILAYLIAALIVYFRLLPSARDRKDQLILLLPFLVTPLLIYILRRVLTWWYHRKVAKGDSKLAALREKKAKILDEVMEKETYKVAKLILDKFAPSRLVTPPRPLGQPSLRPGTAGTDLRRRPGAAPLATPQVLNSSAPALSSATPTPSSRPGGLIGQSGGIPGGVQGAGAAGGQGGRGSGPAIGRGGGPPGPPAVLGPAGGRGGAPGPPLPRPVLPRERGYLDKFVEYLVGDGPANRFALICRQCQSHNGMALREEFEYVAYRCCYCYYWNPARKQRPVAPRLPDAATLPQSGASSDSSDDDSEPPSRRDSLVIREALEKEDSMGMNLKQEEEQNLGQGEKESVEKGEKENVEIGEENVEKGDGGQDILDKKAEMEEVEDKVSNDNILSPEEGACAEQSSEEQSVATDLKSEIKQNVLEEPEEEKLGEVVDDDEALGADWGLVINQAADANEKPASGVNLDVGDGEVVPCEEPMEVVEDEAVPDIIEKKEEGVNQENEL